MGSGVAGTSENPGKLKGESEQFQLLNGGMLDPSGQRSGDRVKMNHVIERGSVNQYRPSSSTRRDEIQKAARIGSSVAPRELVGDLGTFQPLRTRIRRPAKMLPGRRKIRKNRRPQEDSPRGP